MPNFYFENKQPSFKTNAKNQVKIEQVRRKKSYWILLKNKI